MSSYTVEVHRGDHELVVIAFPPRWLRLEVDDLDGNPRTAERPETLREVIARMPNVVAAVDAAMFEVDDGLPYATSQRSRLIYRYLDLGGPSPINIASSHPTRGATLSVDGRGFAYVIEGDAVCDGAVFAHQGYPAMVINGRNIASREKDLNRTGRAAMLLCEDGRVAFAVSKTGIRELAAAVLRLPGGLRAKSAMYLDGGGSTAAYACQGGQETVAVGMNSRRVPAYVLAIQPREGR